MRLLDWAIYFVLIVGAITVVYPFLLMLSTSITSSPDTNEFRIAPRYLNDVNVLFAKFADDKYGGDINALNSTYGTDFLKAVDVKMPDDMGKDRAKRFLQEWKTFEKGLSNDDSSCGFRGYGLHPSELSLAYQKHLLAFFNSDLAALNKSYNEECTSVKQVMPPAERPTSRTWAPNGSAKMRDFMNWKKDLDPHWKILVSVDGLYAQFLIDFLNMKQEVARRCTLQPDPPADPKERATWELYVRTKLPLRFIRVKPGAETYYRDYLLKRYKGLPSLNDLYKTHYTSFNEVQIPTKLLPDDLATRDFSEFIEKALPLQFLRVSSPEIGFRAALQTKYGDVATVNRTFGSNFKSMAAITPPRHAEDAQYVLDNRTALRERHVTRNYSIVLDYILVHGRSLWVTVLFCVAAVITALIVNPMCAYALSRFNLSYSYSLLLFVLATMAFPAEVVMIPNFLLLKELGMLNTFAALILPGVASGYSIFLLKGFFDSLPAELYEAGTIDGASDIRMFFTVTVPMSKPIFAVIALGAFTAAYGAFMFALLVCQDPKMWTLMVWLYDLQNTSPQYVMMAGLTLAALPTLLVFAFAQKVIMRGIVIPMEK
jgi:multiple sugar transport system permease protein